MKKIIYVILLFCVATSCATLSRTRTVSTYFADYRPYIASGFWISPDPYIGDYDPIGELYIEIKPAIEKKTETFNPGDSPDTTFVYVKEVIDFSELMEIAYEEAKDKGANGIVNFKIRTVTNTSKYGSWTETDAYIIEGLLIKIRCATNSS